jgi:F-type H+-transporting ATPase subunit alpha
MAQYRELAAFSQFSSDLDPKTKAMLERGQRINEILKQGWDTPIPVEQQVALFWAVSKGFIDTVKISEIKHWQVLLLEYFSTMHLELLAQIYKEKKLTEAIEAQLKTAMTHFQDTHPELMIEADTKE